MNVATTLRGLLRRWYIVVAGILLAAVAGYATWTHIPPTYVRSASQLLLPGSGSLPPGEDNPYLYLGGLLPATEVVARVAGSNATVAEIIREHPGTQITVVRDPSSSGPVILITVSATSDAVAADAINKVAAQSGIELAKLQNTQTIRPQHKISVSTLTIDQNPTLEQRKRIVATGAAAGGILAISLLLASLIDGLVLRRRHPKAGDGTSDDAATAESLPDAPAPDDPAPTDPTPGRPTANDPGESPSVKVLDPVSGRG